MTTAMSHAKKSFSTPPAGSLNTEPTSFLQSTGSCDSMQSSHQLRPRIFVAFDGPLWRQLSDTCHGLFLDLELELSACASAVNAS